MPTIRFLGNYDVLAEGKFLFEILTQLRNVGVGRMVTNGEWMRKWPEQPSYCLIRKAKPEMDRWLWKGTVWAEWVHRGRNLGVYEFSKEMDRADWSLIHRRDEHKYKVCTNPFEKLTLPSRIPLPPWQQYLIKSDFMVRGESPEKHDLTVRTVPALDNEHEFLRKCIEIDSDMELSPEQTIYDIDPKPFLDLYGKELPVKVEKWDVPM